MLINNLWNNKPHTFLFALTMYTQYIHSIFICHLDTRKYPRNYMPLSEQKGKYISFHWITSIPTYYIRYYTHIGTQSCVCVEKPNVQKHQCFCFILTIKGCLLDPFLCVYVCVLYVFVSLIVYDILYVVLHFPPS